MAAASLPMAALVRLALVAILVSHVSAQNVLSGQCEPDPANDEKTLFAELGSTVTSSGSTAGNLFDISIEIKSNQLILGLRVYFAYTDSNGTESTDGVNIICKSLWYCKSWNGLEKRVVFKLHSHLVSKQPVCHRFIRPPFGL